MGMFLLPPASGVCQECATAHRPDEAHNARSLHYQYHFYSQQGRWPTWKDAIAHLKPEIQAMWRDKLTEMGAWTEPESEIPDVMPAADGSIGQTIKIRTNLEE